MTEFLAIEGIVETNALALDIIAELPVLDETVETTLLVLGEISEFLMFGGTDETTVQVFDDIDIFPDEVVDTIELALEEITELRAREGRRVGAEGLERDNNFSNLIGSEVELKIFFVSFQYVTVKVYVLPFFNPVISLSLLVDEIKPNRRVSDV